MGTLTIILLCAALVAGGTGTATSVAVIKKLRNNKKRNDLLVSEVVKHAAHLKNQTYATKLAQDINAVGKLKRTHKRMKKEQQTAQAISELI